MQRPSPLAPTAKEDPAAVGEDLKRVLLQSMEDAHSLGDTMRHVVVIDTERRYRYSLADGLKSLD
jgi:hypothetical protein